MTSEGTAEVVTTCHCGNSDTQDIVSIKHGVSVVRCPECGQLRTSTRALAYTTLYTEGEDYHLTTQQQFGMRPYKDRFDHDFTIAQGRLNLIGHLVRLLDVGCANGAFVAAAAQRGFNAEGLELNPDIAAWASRTSGCPVHTGWETLRGEYDIITYHDVFEHTVDPTPELRRLRRHLRIGGLLVLDVPDGDEVFGPRARARHHEKPEQHLWYFTEESLVALLRHHGFLIVDVDRPIVGKLVVYARKA